MNESRLQASSGGNTRSDWGSDVKETGSRNPWLILAVLCGEQPATPVVNAGSLYT